MKQAARCRYVVQAAILLPTLLLSSSLFETAAAAADIGHAVPPAASTPLIVVGFVGGFVHNDDERHAEVQLAEKLRTGYGADAEVGIFQNHHREDAHAAILKWLDRDGKTGLSNIERNQARIVLYGHSWGASAAIGLARQLQNDHIPVLLTIQVDSIWKPGEDDRLIPSNVARAINFYQTQGLLHGRDKIAAADPARTEILGDFRYDYKRTPESCSAYPWLARHLFKGHTSIECDPYVWSRVEALITQYLAPRQVQSAAADSGSSKTNPE